jgi:hypothetical protein
VVNQAEPQLESVAEGEGSADGNRARTGPDTREALLDDNEDIVYVEPPVASDSEDHEEAAVMPESNSAYLESEDGAWDSLSSIPVPSQSLLSLVSSVLTSSTRLPSDSDISMLSFKEDAEPCGEPVALCPSLVAITNPESSSSVAEDGEESGKASAELDGRLRRARPLLLASSILSLKAKFLTKKRHAPVVESGDDSEMERAQKRMTHRVASSGPIGISRTAHREQKLKAAMRSGTMSEDPE